MVILGSPQIPHAHSGLCVLYLAKIPGSQDGYQTLNEKLTFFNTSDTMLISLFRKFNRVD